MAAYWISLKRGQERLGFSAETPNQTLAAVEAKLREGWNEIRIIDPEGIETSASDLRIAVDFGEVEPA